MSEADNTLLPARFPADWAISTVGAQFHVILGKMLDAEKNSGTPKPYIGNRSVQWGHVDVSNLDQIKLTDGDMHKYRLQAGDLLVCEGGEIGRAAIWQDQLIECYFQKALHRLRPKGSYSSVLMRYFLEYYAKTGFLANFATQTSIAHLPKDKFLTVPIPLPSHHEQQAMTRALSDADGAVAVLERLIAKKRLIKQGAMQDLLTARRRLPGFSGEWHLKKLADICRLEIGGTPSRRIGRYWGKGHPWITIADLQSKIVVSSKQEITDEGAATQAVVRAGTLIMSFKLSIGRLAFCGRDVFTNEAICSFNNLSEDPNFLYYALTRVDFALYGKQAVKGYTLNKQSLKEVGLMMPKKNEQQAIAAVLSDIDAEIQALEARLAKARAIKEGMMQNLLSGRVRLV